MGFAGHLVLSNASRARNISTLFFMLEWDQYALHKNCTGTCYAEFVFWHPVGSTGRPRSAFQSIRVTKHRHNIFQARVGTMQLAQKTRSDTLR
jgi:hypothetical protein